MITYRVGGVYLLRNYITKAGRYFEPTEILPFGAHNVLYGEQRPYQIRTYRGISEFAAVPAAFPVVNFAQDGKRGAAALAMAIRVTGGDSGTRRPWGQWRISECRGDQQAAAVKGEDEGEAEPLYDIGRDVAEMWRGVRYVEGWAGRTPNRDGMVYAACQSLRLYQDILREGQVPQWFKAQREIYRSRAQLVN